MIFNNREQIKNMLRISMLIVGEHLLIRHSYYRNNHFFQTYAAMLKGIAVVIYKMIVIIRVAKKNIAFGKNKRRVHIWHRQCCFPWILNRDRPGARTRSTFSSCHRRNK